MRTEVIDASPAALARAAAVLARGGVVAFPTETVYGLGARVDRPAGIREIFEAKGRPSDKPLILHVSGIEQAKAAAASWDERAQRLAERFWPGPVTIVVSAAAWVPPEVTAGGSTVAVRAPGHPVALALIDACGCAIAAPSANRSGDEPPTTAAGVVASLGGHIPLVIDGGETPYRVPSTLVRLDADGARILRAGAVSQQAIADALLAD